MHLHTLAGSNTPGTAGVPTGATLAQPSSAIGHAYGPATSQANMAPQAVVNA